MKLTKAKDSLKEQEDCIYYVYEHIADGAVFYVGKGQGDRCKSTERNKVWRLTAKKAKKLEYRIVAWREEEADALSMERQVWLSHVQAGTVLVNAAEPKNQVVYKEVVKEKIVKEYVDKEVIKTKTEYVNPVVGNSHMADFIVKYKDMYLRAAKQCERYKIKVDKLEAELIVAFDLMKNNLEGIPAAVEVPEAWLTYKFPPTVKKDKPKKDEEKGDHFNDLPF